MIRFAVVEETSRKVRQIVTSAKDVDYLAWRTPADWPPCRLIRLENHEDVGATWEEPWPEEPKVYWHELEGITIGQAPEGARDVSAIREEIRRRLGPVQVTRVLRGVRPSAPARPPDDQP